MRIMAILRAIDPAGNLVSMTCTGAITMTDIRDAFLEMLDDPAFRPGANMLWDFRTIEKGAATEEEIVDLVSMVKENQPRRGSGYKVALLADKDLFYGLTRMYQAYSGSLPFEVMAFRSMDEASQWLAETAAD